MKAEILPLPAPIAAYWAAANRGASEAAAACFAPDATVHDEHQHHAGRAAIAAWIEESTRKYHPVVEPLRHTEAAGQHLVTGRVSGDFPGSPVELEFVFTLEDDRIAALEIR